MSIAPAAGVTTATSAPTGAGLGSLNSTDFLQLLVAQVTNQNPLDPVSSSQFMAQTAELSTLEQITSLNQQAAKSLTANRMSEAVQTLGKTVTAVTDTGARVSGTVTQVDQTSNGPLLEVGGSLIPLSGIESVT